MAKKKQIEIAYDFDGVVSEGIIPVEGSAIITGRDQAQEEYTRADLAKMGRGELPIYFFPDRDLLPQDTAGRNQVIAEHKGNTIKELGVKTFYEDNPVQAHIIKTMNPETDVVIVKPMKEAKRLKYIVFSYYMQQAGSVAWQLQHEGCVVDFGQIEDCKMTLTDGEKGNPEDPEDLKRRLSVFDGLLSKNSADKLLRVMPDIQNKEDYFIFCDMNNCFKYAERALAMGFTKGIFPTQEDRLREVERDESKKIVKEHYPGIKLKDYKTFKLAQEGIDFMAESQFAYVLKSLGDSGETIVPKTDNLELNRKEVVDALTNNRKDYEENGYLLEQKILNGIEFTPECLMWNGKPLYYILDLETKTIGAGETGSNVGCGTNLVIETDAEEKINKLAFPDYLFEKYKDDVGMRVEDCGLLLDPADNSIYFLEFCPNRCGWDSFPAELTMGETADQFFENVAKGKNPLKYKYGTAVRVFNDTLDHDRRPAAGIGMSFKRDLYDYVFPYDVKQAKEPQEEDDFYHFETAGYARDAAAITCKMDTVKGAIETIYDDYLHDFSMKDMAYRPVEDFLSFGYAQAILNRLDYLCKIGLIKDAKIKKDLEEAKASPKRVWKFEKPNEPV